MNSSAAFPAPWVAALLALTLPHVAVAQPAPTETSAGDHVVRVGTWNLEHFGARPGLGERTPAQMDAIAAYLRDLEVDVLAVQEIRTREALDGLTQRLGPTWKYVLGTSGGFRDGSGGIRLGFLWNSAAVELVQAEELLQLPSEVDSFPIFHRKPISAVFRARGGGTDFRAITVHLKANSRGRQNQKNIAKRVRETGALRAWLKELVAREGEDKDILVLGDFNHTYDAPAHHTFREGGFLRYLKPAHGTPRTIVHFEAPIDHVAVLPGIRRDLATGHVVVHHEQADRDLEAWRATYSDHIPVTVDLRAGPDADPEATFAPVGPNQWLRAGGLAAAAPARAATSPDPANRARPTAATPATAPAPAPAPAAIGRIATSFQAGARVEVHGLDDSIRPMVGTLLAPLAGDWVQIRTDTGQTIAYPRNRVKRVVALGR